MDSVTVAGALGTAMTTVASDATNAITTILPIAAPILGALIVIAVGIKVFKRFSGTRP